MSTLTYARVRDAAADAAPPAYNQPPSGYGTKIPTRYRVRLTTDRPGARWRRVYAMSYGNAASLYVVVKGTDVFLRDTDLSAVLEASHV